MKDKPIGRVPILDDVQSFVDLLAQRLGLQILAEKDRLHGFAQFQQCLIGGMLEITARESAENRLGIRRSQAQGGRIFDDLIVLLANEIPIDSSGQHGVQLRIRVRVSRFWAIELLGMQGLETRQQFESEQMTKGKRDFTLAMRIDILFGDLHIGAMPQHPFHHRGHLRRRTGFELRIDTGRFLLDMPVDHHAWSAIPHMPFRHEVLIPGAKLFGVRGTGGRALTPDGGEANTKDRIDDLRDRGAQLLFGEVLPSDIAQVIIRGIRPTRVMYNVKRLMCITLLYKLACMLMPQRCSV